jgi:hypothetical protein
MGLPPLIVFKVDYRKVNNCVNEVFSHVSRGIRASVRSVQIIVSGTTKYFAAATEALVECGSRMPQAGG